LVTNIRNRMVTCQGNFSTCLCSYFANAG